MIFKIINKLNMMKIILRSPDSLDIIKKNKQPDLLSPVVSRYRVLPHELDLRDHLPNYAFFRFTEMNINKWAFQNKLPHRKDYDVWVLAASQVVFLKQIKALKKFSVKTQVMYWDKKYAYFQHEFFIESNNKHKKPCAAILLSKLVFMANNTQTAPEQILGNLPSENPVIDSWLMNQQQIKAFFQ